jgi:hypothetical protein
VSNVECANLTFRARNQWKDFTKKTHRTKPNSWMVRELWDEVGYLSLHNLLLYLFPYIQWTVVPVYSLHTIHWSMSSMGNLQFHVKCLVRCHGWTFVKRKSRWIDVMWKSSLGFYIFMFFCMGMWSSPFGHLFMKLRMMATSMKDATTLMNLLYLVCYWVLCPTG